MHASFIAAVFTSLVTLVVAAPVDHPINALGAHAIHAHGAAHIQPAGRRRARSEVIVGSAGKVYLENGSTSALATTTTSPPSTFLMAPSTTFLNTKKRPSATTASSTTSPAPKVSVSASASATATATAAASKLKFIATSYYPDWTGDVFPPETVDYSKFDRIYFAFALPTAKGGLYFTQNDSVDLLQRLVTGAHTAGKEVVVSVGGWTGSTYFSSIVSTSTGRSTLAKNMANMISNYNLDGIDIDWEYPGSQGASGNAVSSSDTTNLLSFLKQLRALIGTTKTITMAVAEGPWQGPNGQLTDVSPWAAYLDHVLVMNYDVWGSSTTPGPNAPLSDGCHDSWQPTANAQAAINAWSKAKMPLSKLLLGLPSYGYVSSSSATSLQDRLRKRSLLPRDQFVDGSVQGRVRRSSTAHRPPHSTSIMPTYCPDNHSGTGCSAPPAASSTHSAKAPNPSSPVKTSGAGDLSQWMGSQIEFNQLISAGALVKSNNGSYVGHSGYTRRWDACSSTPFLTNPTRNTVVTYDDPQSITLKAQYAAQRLIAGVGFWDLTGDTSDWALIKAARAGLGLA